MTVCVTGASGFIASHIVKELLARGYRVRGTVRSPNEQGAAHLRRMPHAVGNLELISADLLDAGVWSPIVAGCAAVLHTASPYALSVSDPRRDLVEPALQGTRNVLNACLLQSRRPRVVVTSSMAAITDEPDSDHVLTEADWNTSSTLERNPYYLSKTLAEREAWKIAEGGLQLVAINPFLVIGPSFAAQINPSNAVFADVLNGTYPGIMRLQWGFVDVRDVALAHVAALETPTAAGRYICAAGTISMREVVELLIELGYGDCALPKLGLDCPVGDYAVRLSSYFQPRGVGSYLRTHIGREPRFDNSKIQRELSLRFRALDHTIRETVEDLIRHGHIQSRVPSPTFA